MNNAINIVTGKADLFAEIAKVMNRYPEDMRDMVRKAYEAADEQDFEEAEKLCLRLLACRKEPEVRMLLGTCYFMEEKMYEAVEIFSGLTDEYPEEEQYRIYLGMTYHALGMYEETVRELKRLYPLRVYHPFYYISYGDSLLQIGRKKEGRDALYEEIAYYKKTGMVLPGDMLSSTFQNVLYLDVTLGNGKYPEDLELYYEFLEQVEMTDMMQEYLAANIVYFCGLMSNQWYRPLFLEFITQIRDRGFLTNEGPLEVLESAFASWESYGYHEDRRISALMETYLSSTYERRYGNTDQKEEKERIEVTALTYEWYLCQYGPEHPEEMDHIRDTYPRTYANNQAFFERVKKDARGTAQEIEKLLYPYSKRGGSKEEFEESLLIAYKKACGNTKEPVYVYDGEETYRRMQPKVGRNDPCPCGSGKKYKKCCGR